MRRKVFLALWATLCLSVASVAEGRAYATVPDGTLTGTCTLTGTVTPTDDGPNVSVDVNVTVSGCTPTDPDDFIWWMFTLTTNDGLESQPYMVGFYVNVGESWLDAATSTATVNANVGSQVGPAAGAILVPYSNFQLCRQGDPDDGDCVGLGEPILAVTLPSVGGPFGDGSEVMDFATDVATFMLVVMLPAVLIALAAGAALSLIYKAIRRVTSSVG